MKKVKNKGNVIENLAVTKDVALKFICDLENDPFIIDLFDRNTINEEDKMKIKAMDFKMSFLITQK